MSNVVPVVLEYKIPCDYAKDGSDPNVPPHVTKRLYPLMIDDQKFMFCSQQHYVKARDNWEEKKKLGLTNPSIPTDLTQPQDAMETDLGIPEI